MLLLNLLIELYTCDIITWNLYASNLGPQKGFHVTSRASIRLRLHNDKDGGREYTLKGMKECMVSIQITKHIHAIYLWE